MSKSIKYQVLGIKMRGMTLIETLVAISILGVAIVAPMSLTMQSLAAAYYAKDQITASHLAQEAVESVRALRDGNILIIAINSAGAPCTPMTILCGIPVGTEASPVNFMIDSTDTGIDAVERCDADGTGECDALQTDGELYGYDAGWTDTPFTRAVHVEYVGDDEEEIRVTSTVTWRSRAFQDIRTYTITENLYKWIDDGSAE